jgi:threonylcarbamoyladenosine tRNA methylthiotransferase MtaB
VAESKPCFIGSFAVMNARAISLTTLGCKLNYAETAAIEQSLVQQGHHIVPLGEPCDLLIINSCTVTENANEDCNKLIRKVHRASPNAAVAVTGCYAQLQPQKIASLKGVTTVVGSAEKHLLVHAVEACIAGNMPKIMVSDLTNTPFVPARSAEGVGRTRAFLKVQDGCDYVCTFCTIPQARGASRSMPLHEVHKEAKRLQQEGYKEVVLTGVNVGEYSSTTHTLLDVLEVFTKQPYDFRVRVSSIEPNTLKPPIIELLASNSVFAKHVHIPLQHGTNDVLRLMKRRYTVERYQETITLVQKHMPFAAIGIDVITGFPGETDELFEQSVMFIESLPFTYLHVFTYSERSNTPATTMKGVVPKHVRKQRTAVLRALSAKRTFQWYSTFSGTKATVIAERVNAKTGEQFGYTNNYLRVKLPNRVAQNSEVFLRLGAVALVGSEAHLIGEIDE